jgi:hypothetical protein
MSTAADIAAAKSVKQAVQQRMAQRETLHFS